MILSSHIIAASALSLPFANSADGILGYFKVFIISLLSHYFLDLIPHWDYSLSSVYKYPPNEKGVSEQKFILDKKLIVKDLIKTSLDGLVGATGAFMIFFIILGATKDARQLFVMALIIFGGIFPDAIEYLYLIFEKKYFIIAHKFHSTIHGVPRFKNNPLLGALTQALIIIFIVAAMFLFFSRV